MELRVENVFLSLGSESFYLELRLQEKEQPMEPHSRATVTSLVIT